MENSESERCPRGLATTRAVQRMASILSDGDRRGWNLADLMTLRLGIITQQQSSAVGTTDRSRLDDLIHLVQRFELPPVSLMTRLSTTTSTTRLFLLPWWLIRRIRGGRQ